MEMESFDSCSREELDIICNMISVLPVEYDQVTEVTEYESGLPEELENHKPLCYNVINSDTIG